MRPVPTTPRLPDWPERLAAFLEERRNRPFGWGQQDCALLAADAVLLLTGQDPAEGSRSYGSEAEAEALIEAAGGLGELAAARMAVLGCPEIAPAFAQRGDAVLLLVGNQPTLGVCVGARVAAPGPDGLVFLPLRMAERAWAV